MKGIILAGGTGSRLFPSTIALSKQLIPVYDKPMVYYPLSTLMLAGVQDILVITTPSDQSAFKKLLGDGTNFGISISYEIQEEPKGLAQALIIGEKFLKGEASLLILGDNIFYGVGLGQELNRNFPEIGGQIFTYEVSNPRDYGIVELDGHGVPLSIQEKPEFPKSNLAVTGLYYFDSSASEVAKKLKPSSRGELEITSLIDWYLKRGELRVTKLSRGTAWLDTGNQNSMHDASTFVRIIEERTGLKIGCPEEIAFRNGWISRDFLTERANFLSSSGYGKYLLGLN